MASNINYNLYILQMSALNFSYFHSCVYFSKHFTGEKNYLFVLWPLSLSWHIFHPLDASGYHPVAKQKHARCIIYVHRNDEYKNVSHTVLYSKTIFLAPPASAAVALTEDDLHLAAVIFEC
jgi:hypothetical protein